MTVELEGVDNEDVKEDSEKGQTKVGEVVVTFINRSQYYHITFQIVVFLYNINR